MPAEEPNEPKNPPLMSGEKAIRDDLGGDPEPTEEQEETLERKVEEARERLDSEN